MIEVHPPHHAASGWRDFFVHIATICVGLLIAISLEQGVEWLHRVEQRHQLQEDLREEGERNKELVDADIKSLDSQWAAAAGRIREVLSELAKRRKQPQPYPSDSYAPEGEKLIFVLPSTAAWTTAKDGARIELLPRDVARRYARLYAQLDYVSDSDVIRREAVREIEAYRCRFDDGALPCIPDFAAMSNEQLDEYLGLGTRIFANYREEKLRLLTFGALNEMVLEGESLEDQDTAIKAEYRWIEEHPDVYLKPNSDPARSKPLQMLHP